MTLIQIAQLFTCADTESLELLPISFVINLMRLESENFVIRWIRLNFEF